MWAKGAMNLAYFANEKHKDVDRKERWAMDKRKHGVYLGVAMVMMIFAVPQLQMGQGWTLPTIFGVCWLFFALCIIAVHLHMLLRVDDETRSQLNRVRKQRRRLLIQEIERRLARRS
jgi:hypothetical protein